MIVERETSRCIGGQLFRGRQGPEVAFEYFSVWLTESDVLQWQVFLPYMEGKDVQFLQLITW